LNFLCDELARQAYQDMAQFFWTTRYLWAIASALWILPSNLIFLSVYFF